MMQISYASPSHYDMIDVCLLHYEIVTNLVSEQQDILIHFVRGQVKNSKLMHYLISIIP